MVNAWSMQGHLGGKHDVLPFDAPSLEPAADVPVRAPLSFLGGGHGVHLWGGEGVQDVG